MSTPTDKMSQNFDFSGMSDEELDAEIAKLQGTPTNFDFSGMSDEELDAEIAKLQGVGGPATFGEAIQRGREGVISPFGRAAMGLASFAEDILGVDADPLKQYGEKVIEDSQTRLAGIGKDKTTFKDVEDTFEEKGFLPTVPIFGQYAKEVIGEQLPNLGAFAGATSIGSLVGRVALGATGPIGGIIGGASFLIPHFFGNNAERIQEVKGEGYELDTNDYTTSLKAALAQTPLAMFADRILLGLGPTPKLLNSGGIFSRVSLNTTAGVFAEVPTEIGEAVIERYQAGLPVDDEEAIEEYREVGFAAGLFGGTTRATTSAGQAIFKSKENTKNELLKNEELQQLDLFADPNAADEIANTLTAESIMNAEKETALIEENQAVEDELARVVDDRQLGFDFDADVDTTPTGTRTIKTYDIKGQEYDAEVVAESEDGSILVKNNEGNEVLLGLDPSAVTVNANDPSYVVNASGNSLNRKVINELDDTELDTLIKDETDILLEAGGSGRGIDAATNINAAKLEQRRRRGEEDTPTVDKKPEARKPTELDPVDPLEQKIEDFRTRSFLSTDDIPIDTIVEVDQRPIDPRFFLQDAVQINIFNKQLKDLKERAAAGTIEKDDFNRQKQELFAKVRGLPFPLNTMNNKEVADFIKLSKSKDNNSYTALETITDKNEVLKQLGGDIAAGRISNEALESPDIISTITDKTQNFGKLADDELRKLFFPRSGGRYGRSFYENLNDNEKAFVIESARKYREDRLERDVKGTVDKYQKYFQNEINRRKRAITASKKEIEKIEGSDSITEEDSADQKLVIQNNIKNLNTQIQNITKTQEEYIESRDAYNKEYDKLTKDFFKAQQEIDRKKGKDTTKERQKLNTIRKQRDSLKEDYTQQLDSFNERNIEEEAKATPLFTNEQERFITEFVNPFKQQAIKFNQYIGTVLTNNYEKRIDGDTYANVIREGEGFEQIAKSFQTLFNKAKENNISNEFLVGIINQTIPQMQIRNPDGFGIVDLRVPLLDSLDLKNLGSLINDVSNESRTALGTDTQQIVQALIKLKRKKDLEAATVKEDVLKEISELLNVSESVIDKKINILKNPSESEIANIPARASGAVFQGKVFLFTDNIKKGREKSVFLHEVGVHVGMKKLLGGNFNNLFNRIKKFTNKKFKDTKEQIIAKRAIARLREDTTTKTLEQRKEEAIAYFVEEAVAAGIDPSATAVEQFADSNALKNWFTQFKSGAVAAIKKIFKFMGLTAKSMSAENFVDLAYGGAKLSILDDTGIFYDKEKGKFKLRRSKNDFSQKLNLSMPGAAEAMADEINNEAIGKSRIDLLPIADEKFLTTATDKLLESPKWARRAFYYGLSFTQLADTVRRFSPSLANAIQKIETVSAEKRYAIEEYRGMFRDDIIKLKVLMDPYKNTDTLKKFNRITTDSSMKDDDGKRYDLREYFKRNPNPEVVNSKIYQEFLTLPEELKVAYKIVVDRYEKIGKVYQDSVLNLITEESVSSQIKTKSELEEELNNQDITSTRRVEIIQKIRKLDERILTERQKIAKQLFTSGKIEPFIPLVRQGRYWIKEAGDKDTSPSYAFTTMEAAERAKKYLVSKGVELVENPDGSVIFEKVGNEDTLYGSMDNGAILEAMKIIRKQLGADPNDSSNAKIQQMLGDIQEVYISSQPKESIMQQFKRRREVPGFEDDILQNFAHMGMKYANQIATLQYNAEINRTYDEATSIASPGGRAGKKYAEVIATLQGRKEFLLDPVPSTWSAVAAYGGYGMYILGNISSAVINLSQLFLVGTGLMGGEFGFNKTTKAIQDGFKLYASGGRDDNTELAIGKVSLKDYSLFAKDGRTMKDPKRLKEFGVTVEEMQQLYDTAILRSGVRRSSAQELQDVRRGNVDQFTGTYSKAELALGWFFQNSERMNREIALFAAFKLAKDKYKKANTEQLINRALEIVEDINGPALSETGPEIFQNNLGKALGVFKRFAFSQIYLQYKLLRDAFFTLKTIERNPNLPDEMPSVQQLAKRQFFASFVPAMLFAGLRGAPFFGAIALMHDLIADDDEEDFDMVARGAVGDIFYRGPLSHFTNIDFASRTGFYQLAFRDDPYRRAQIGNVAFTLEQIGGPVYSIIRSPDRALDYYNKGETDKAIETMLPSFIRNPLKAIRFGTEGALNSKGYPLVDDVTGYNQALQLFGFAPNDLANQYQKNEFITRLERGLNTKRQRLLTKYYLATQLDDQEEIQSIRKEIREFNDRRVVREGKLSITADTIKKSFNMRDRKAREAVNGIVVPEAIRSSILEELDFQE